VKIAAIQMKVDLANVKENLKKADGLAHDAFKEGAECVILPELFTSAVGFNKKMMNAALPLEGPAMEMLLSVAKTNNGIVGGSYIAWHGNECYNTFVLAMPDGTIYLHNKDLPTMWENCYYVGGSDNGILDTPSLKIGVALCWEFIRSQTAHRLINKVDMVIGGSCWWTLPKKRLPGFPQKLHDKNLEVMKSTIPRFAKMLGVPVVHAAHAGEVSCSLPLLPGFPYQSFFLGETQIVDGTGKQLAHMGWEEGDGYVIADVDVRKKQPASEKIPDRFWIPDLPIQFKFIWAYQNWHGKKYYRKKTRPVMLKRFAS
jgi:predicted amidohydrolase